MNALKRLFADLDSVGEVHRPRDDNGGCDGARGRGADDDLAKGNLREVRGLLPFAGRAGVERSGKGPVSGETVGERKKNRKEPLMDFTNG